MGELVKLPNIGPELERQLHLIGVDTVEELRRRGSKQAWLDIQKNDPSACFHRLCSLEGALHGVRKIMLPDEVKADLQEFHNEHTKR